MLDCVELQPPETATASVIWLHGLGADGNDFVPIVPELGFDEAHGVRFIFPHAPQRPVSLNNGMPMRAWYDLVGVDVAAHPDRTGIEASAKQIEALIEREIEAGLPAARIVLAGFSQGGAVALYTGLRQSTPLAGILALSTYLPLPEDVLPGNGSAGHAGPIFMAHGSADPIVPIALGRRSRDLLIDSNHAVDWQEYPMAHQVCAPEITAIGQWLRARFGMES